MESKIQFIKNRPWGDEAQVTVTLDNKESYNIRVLVSSDAKDEAIKASAENQVAKLIATKEEEIEEIEVLEEQKDILEKEIIILQETKNALESELNTK